MAQSLSDTGIRGRSRGRGVHVCVSCARGALYGVAGEQHLSRRLRRTLPSGAAVRVRSGSARRLFVCTVHTIPSGERRERSRARALWTMVRPSTCSLERHASSPLDLAELIVIMRSESALSPESRPSVPPVAFAQSKAERAVAELAASGLSHAAIACPPPLHTAHHRQPTRRHLQEARHRRPAQPSREVRSVIALATSTISTIVIRAKKKLGMSQNVDAQSDAPPRRLAWSGAPSFPPFLGRISAQIGVFSPAARNWVGPCPTPTACRAVRDASRACRTRSCAPKTAWVSAIPPNELAIRRRPATRSWMPSSASAADEARSVRARVR